MKVAVGKKIYDTKDQPIALILTDQDKQNISNMTKDARFYMCYPDHVPDEEMDVWMDAIEKECGNRSSDLPRFTQMDQMSIVGKGIVKVVDRKGLSIEEIANLKGAEVIVDDERVKVLSSEIFAEDPGVIHFTIEYLDGRERKT